MPELTTCWTLPPAEIERLHRDIGASTLGRGG
jgi:hypothetical protein